MKFQLLGNRISYFAGRPLPSLLALAIVVFAFNSASATGDDLDQSGTELAAKYCYRCHGGEKSKGNKEFNILDQTSLLTSDERYAIVGDTENSAIWQRVSDEEMPPEDEPQMTDEEKATFKKWLFSGAPIHKASVPVSAPPADDSAPVEAPKPAPVAKTAPEPTAQENEFANLSEADLAIAGRSLLENRCGDCHPGNGPAAFDVKDITRMTTSKKKVVVPGDPAASRIYKAVMSGSMPYDENGDPAPLPETEKALLKKWIEAGAPYPEIESREFIPESYVWDAAFNDLRTIPEFDRAKTRYFSLLNIHNNSKRYSNDELKAHWAALSKVCNSLSSESSIVAPHKVDDKGILWRINMDDYGWNDLRYDGCGTNYSAWGLMLHEYPYGVSHAEHDKLEFRANYEYVVETTQSQLPVMRADWFMVNATQNELYYLINKIPSNAFYLEQDLGIDIPGDFRRGRLVRAALLDSGVSHTNRLMDRHTSGRTGYYWKSYDFNKELKSQRDLTVFPLGPKTYGLDQPHLRRNISEDILIQRAAFEEDGGEIIYQMPNGMQGYMLVDNVGRRLNAGPNEVVRDKFETAGTAQVRNALSCIRCHAGGMKDFTDDIAENIVVGGSVKRHAESLFRPKGHGKGNEIRCEVIHESMPRVLRRRA